MPDTVAALRRLLPKAQIWKSRFRSPCRHGQPWVEIRVCIEIAGQFAEAVGRTEQQAVRRALRCLLDQAEPQALTA